MNDPHVSAILYRVKHDETVSYDQTKSFEYETDSFKVLIKDREARFEMKEHFPTIEQAREVIEPFIRQWEFTAALERGPGEFDLVFLDAVVEDRKPTPGVVQLQGIAMVLATGSLSAVVGRNTYPTPSTGIALNANVEAMVHRYLRYRKDRDTLAGMAYFCLTVLEEAAGSRSSISAKFGISASVIAKLGRLTGEKGGAEARKSKGRSHDFADDERAWIDQTVKLLIRRVAEVAHNPDAAKTLKNMDDLPT